MTILMKSIPHRSYFVKGFWHSWAMVGRLPVKRVIERRLWHSSRMGRTKASPTRIRGRAHQRYTSHWRKPVALKAMKMLDVRSTDHLAYTQISRSTGIPTSTLRGWDKQRRKQVDWPMEYKAWAAFPHFHARRRIGARRVHSYRGSEYGMHIPRRRLPVIRHICMEQQIWVRREDQAFQLLEWIYL
jgi:hypothetical protein